MKITSNLEIVKKLKISYDSLETIQQQMLLDITCFFRGMEKDCMMTVLDSCYFGAANIGLNVLIDKSLVFISKHEYGEFDTIQMHDLIEDMGKYIVKLQTNPGERSRLWDVQDIEEVMFHKKGTRAVEVIQFYYAKKLCFRKARMKNMDKLRILSIHWSYYSKESDDSEESDDSKESDDSEESDSIDYLSNNLCWFAWHFYPWKLLPQKFNPQKLVHMDLSMSSLHHLWNKTKKKLPSLQKLDLNFSKSLKSTPDFTGMPNLRYLDLNGCTSLQKVHDSLKYSKKLIWLDLYGCESLESFPCVNVESLEDLNLSYCSSLKKLPEFVGIMKSELEIHMQCSGIRKIRSSIILGERSHLTKLDLNGMNNLVSLPSNICELKDLVELNVSSCSKLKTLPEDIGSLSSLKVLDLSGNNFEHLPRSIAQLGALQSLDLSGCKRLKELPCFTGMTNLDTLNLSYCNLIDGGLPEDIGFLSSLKKLDLRGNNFEHLPRTIAPLGALRYLDISYCKKLKEFPGFTGMTNLDTLNLSYCKLIDGGLLKGIGSLSSLKVLDLSGNNFKYLPRSISQLGALQYLDLSDCKRLKELPEVPRQLDRIDAVWSKDRLCNSLFQNISSLQPDISASYLRVFTSLSWDKSVPRWFHHQVQDTSASVNLPVNWYVSDNFLGFAVCYIGELNNDITAHLIPLCDDGASSMTKKFSLSINSQDDTKFFLVPFVGLWNASKANGKMPNDYGCLRLVSTIGEISGLGVRLLYKDKLQVGMRRSRDEEGSCSSSKKQRPLSQLVNS